MMPLIRSRHLLAGMDARLESPAGLARVWTEENTRESIFTRGTLRKRLPKQACAPVTNLSDLQEQSSIYLPERNAEMRAKRSRAEMELAHASNQLIEKRLAERQLAYLLIGMRQKMLLLPGKLRIKFGEERFPNEMLEAARKFVVEALNEVSRLPEAAEPGWFERLEEDA